MSATLTKPKKWGEYDAETNNRYYPLHKYQQKLLQSKARFTFAFAGVGSGKSCCTPLWLLKQVKKNPQGRFLIISPTFAFFEQSGLLEHFLTLFEPYGTYVAWKHRFDLNSGGTIFFRSADNPTSIEGGQYAALVLDEVGKISRKSWVNAKGRIALHNAPCLGVSTPDANTWIYDEIYSRWKAGDPDYNVIQWSSIDNPAFSKEAFEQAKLTMSPELFARRHLGQFSRLEGLVYDTFADQVIPTPKTLPCPAVRVFGGIDWGWTDPLAAILCIEAQDGRVYVVEELYETQLTVDALSHKLKQMEQKWTAKELGCYFDAWYCDHSRPETKNQLRRRGISAKTKKITQIEQRIALTDARLRTDYLRIFDCCPNLIEESQMYVRQTDRDGDAKEKPTDKHNHALDALSYAISGNDYGRKLDFSISPEEIEMEEEETTPAERLGIDRDEYHKKQQEKELNRRKNYMEALATSDSEAWTVI